MRSRDRLAGMLACLAFALAAGCSAAPEPSGSQLNLWVQAVEITQATQTWVPVNESPLVSGAEPPTFSYPASPTAMPLVANRSTVARVYAGVAGVASVDKARAVLRCFTDPGYSIPCPGTPSLERQGQVRVRVDDSVEAKRNYAALSWNVGLATTWTAAGTIYLEAEILPPEGQLECAGCDDAANRLRVSGVTFQTLPDFSSLVYLVRIRRQVGSQTIEPSEADLLNQVDYLKARYPVDQRTLPGAPGDAWPWDASWLWVDDEDQELGDRCKELHRDLAEAFPNKANKLARLRL